MFDIIFLSTNKNHPEFKKLVKKYPHIKTANTFNEAQRQTLTNMFWVIWPNLSIYDNFDFAFEPNQYDRKYIHTFTTLENTTGVCLFPKDAYVSNRELLYRFFTNSKAVEILSGTEKIKYEVYYTSDYTEYENIIENSYYDLFWVVHPSLQILENFDFSFVVDPDNHYDQNINHMFLNDDCGIETYNGVILCSKNNKLTKDEFESRNLIIRKEHAIVASKNKYYDVFRCDTYDEYEKIFKDAKTNMFYIVRSELEVLSDFKFDFTISLHNKFDLSINHVFLNDNAGILLYNGILLCSKQSKIAREEFDSKLLKEKKEHNILVSKTRNYDVFYPSSYEDYEQIFITNKRDMFWIVHPTIEPLQSFQFDMIVNPTDKFDLNINHVFLNQDIDSLMFNGIILCSKNKKLSKLEFLTKVYKEKKEHNILASKLKPYDIFYISYKDKDADDKFEILSNKFPRIKHIKDVTGIHKAHIQAASLSTTNMFYVIDSDAEIYDIFDFSLVMPSYDEQSVFVWYSKNPINELEYGYGGIKLLPKFKTLKVDINSMDMTTSISDHFNVIEEVVSVTKFNTDPFNTWKSAFRECVKLTTQYLNSKDSESKERLDIWCSCGGQNLYGAECIQGALDGRDYAEVHRNNIDALTKINDFDWLKKYYNDSISGSKGKISDIILAQARATS